MKAPETMTARAKITRKIEYRWTAARLARILDQLEISHHAHVLVFEVVTMKNIASAITRKSNQNVRGLSGAHIDRVFPACIIRTGTAAVPENLKVNQVKMQRMAEISLERPDFGRIEHRTRVHAVRIVWFAVDPPAM